MVQVKSFTDYNKLLDKVVNEWIKKHKDIKIIDIKYNTCISHTGLFRESVLIIYDESTSKQDVTEWSIILANEGKTIKKTKKRSQGTILCNRNW